ncbi:PhoH family protein [Marinoscillum furvescens]|uniref:PhoH-like ATPase n=1 Tax=Marinoscillum furvescens DSM 4134 TaxID=1122208 RepID=A0A3D9L7N4_MARFU|nr:PhoH family protein [Marinoscillum furvescens]REE01495.1 PhoH-like ATPase [Marinoscillum furvescens DSM 4134]
MAKTTAKEKKIFVLDTSVILYAHDSILNFAEHDVGIPITVLEELDTFKKGNDTKNFEAREFTRLLDKLAKGKLLQEWNPLNGKTKGKFKVLMEMDSKVDAHKVFGERKNDHSILNAALTLKQQEKKRQVILVSKDINLRLKAKSLDLPAEDYETGKIKNVNTLHTGKYEINNVSSEVIDELFKKGRVEKKAVLPRKKAIANSYYILKSEKNSVLSYYNPTENTVDKVDKNPVYGIKPRNAEQTFAIHAMMDPEIKLVSINGVAGTGKTLLALASALEQRRNFKQIYLARPIVPLSNKDIGYLPGDIKSKLNPYMEPLWDNLKFIQHQFKESDKEFKHITDMVNKEKLMITPLAYIRGRSLSNIFFIVDEAQNLTPHEIKTIITRAGENCKIIFTGDIYQIDTPYLDSQSNGLSYLIDRIQDHPMYAHITLEKGERSELANLANELL